MSLFVGCSQRAVNCTHGCEVGLDTDEGVIDENSCFSMACNDGFVLVDCALIALE